MRDILHQVCHVCVYVQVLSVIRRRWTQSRSLNVVQTTTAVLGGAASPACGTALLPTGGGGGAETHTADCEPPPLYDDVTRAEGSKGHHQLSAVLCTAATAELLSQHESTDES